MTDDDFWWHERARDEAFRQVTELERELEHACAIAACSIGQPDRAENVAYREEIRAKLGAARKAAGLPNRGG